MADISRVLAFAFLAGALLFPHGATAGHSNAKVGIKIIAKGAGATAIRHSKISVHYTGWLLSGAKFDSSRDRGKPFRFTLGAGQVIRGWDLGVEGMKVGGRRELTIPPELAYGKRGAGKSIPPNATLRFEIELLSVTPPRYANIDNASLKALLAKGVKIVDVRRRDEWDKTGVIAGSKLLTAFDGKGNFVRGFAAALGKLVRPDEAVIVICRVGNRSAVISNMLVEKAGYSKVHNVTNGIAKWIKDGNPVKK